MYHRILVPVDLEQASSWERALPVAEGLAQGYGAALHLITVVPGYGMAMVGGFFPPDFQARAVASCETRLQKLAEDHGLDRSAVGLHVETGTIYQCILHCADAIGADLIVMSSHRPELADYLLGPNAARVVRHARQSVFVVRKP